MKKYAASNLIKLLIFKEYAFPDSLNNYIAENSDQFDETNVANYLKRRCMAHKDEIIEDDIWITKT